MPQQLFCSLGVLALVLGIGCDLHWGWCKVARIEMSSLSRWETIVVGQVGKGLGLNVD